MGGLAIVVPQDGSSKCYLTRVDGLRDLQQLVGGWIEAAPINLRHTDDLSLWINEEGKLDGSLPNLRASVYWRTVCEGMDPRDLIHGNLVISGNDSDTGELADVPDDVLRAFGWHPGIAKDAADGEWFTPHPTSLNTL